jgi:hypothetical protein
MQSFSADPIQKAVHGKHGVMNAIDLLFKNEAFGPGILMIMCGIDIMSNLDRARESVENTPEDFKNWVRRYVCIPGDNILTPDDLWGARNAILHTYGVYSRDVRSGKAKIITWVPNPRWPVRHDPEADANLVMVDPCAFKDAFSSGVQRFLCSALSSESKKPLLCQRLNELITYLPFTFGT